MDPFQSILVHWFLKCRCSLLPFLVWPLPICLDSWTNIPGSYAILLFTASHFTSINSHIHNWVLFLFWLCLFTLSGVISPLISSSILGIYRPGEFIFQCPIFLPFHTVHGLLKQEYWSGLPFRSPVDHVLSEFSTTIPLWTELNQEPWWRTIPPLPVKFSFLFSPEISIIATTSLSTWMYLKWIRVSSLTTGLPFQPLCYWSSTFLKTRLSSSSSFCMTSLSHAHHFLYYILWKLHHDI